MLEIGTIVDNRRLKGDYWNITFRVPAIAAAAQPGQFVHVRIAENKDHILRRPFSIFDADPETGTLGVVYKIVGSGTEELSKRRAGDTCDIMGPLGRPFPLSAENEIPVMVVGGYGSAATYLLAKRSAHKGILLLGARTEADVILTEAYEALGTEVRVATEDGSMGMKGRVTVLLENALEQKNPAYRYAACGPHGMLMAVGRMCVDQGAPEAALSLDHPMCCGIGACFACVVPVCDPTSPDGWRYARSCSEGPVFAANEIWYGEV